MLWLIGVCALSRSGSGTLVPLRRGFSKPPPSMAGVRIGPMLTASLRDRLVAADPGLTRLLMAARATAAVASALLVLVAVARWLHLPPTVPLMGAALGMTWAIAVNDTAPRDQRITTLLLWLPGAACLTLGTFSANNRLLSDALFVCVLFASVYIRRYGPRAYAMGMVAVLAFFFALFLRASFAQLPWLLFALAVTTACAYAVRFYVLSDRPEFAFRNAVAAFRARQRLIRETIDEARRQRRWTFKLQRRINHHVFRLDETAITLDDLLRSTQASEARARVLDAELRTEQQVERVIRDVDASANIPLLQLEEPPFDDTTWTPRGLFKVGTQIDTGRFRPTMRQAIQLTLAAIPAMVVGEFLSAQRWYWAVLTAFVVFSGTTSAGETLRKAWSRVAGTALGVAAGAVVAILVRGNHPAAFALLFVFLFVAVYGLRLSYAVMTFGITAVLSMLYVLLGLFTDQLLGLRLLETAIGAAFGGAAATLILPIHTERVVHSVTAETLNRLRRAVDESASTLTGNASGDPLAAVRAYDEAFQTMRAQLLPLIYNLRLRPDLTLRSRMLLFAACGYSLRALASLAIEAPRDCPVEKIRSVQEHVQTQIDIALRRLDDRAAALPPAEAEGGSDGESSAVLHLERIDRFVHRLTATL